MTPTAGTECLIVGGFTSADSAGDYTAANSGFTFVAASGVAGPLTDPNTGLVYKIETAASGSYQPGISLRNNKYVGVAAVFYRLQTPGIWTIR